MSTWSSTSMGLRVAVVFAAGLALGASIAGAVVLVEADDGGATPAPVRLPTEVTQVSAPTKATAPTSPVARTAEPEPPSPSPSPCAATEGPHTGTRHVSRHIGLDLHEWVIHVPLSYRPGVPHPLVVLFHDDSGADASESLMATGLAKSSEKHGFVVAAPQDSDISYPWNEPSDIAHAEAVVQLTQEMLCIDPARIYLVGYGAGGWGVDQLSCRPWVRGVATASFLYERRAFGCEPARPVPSLTLLPLDSGFLPPDGGPDCLQHSKLSFDEFEAMWSERNQCNDEHGVFAEQDGSRCLRYECEAPFVACRTRGGRRWHGAPVRPIDFFQCDGPSTKFPYNETIWRFFESL